MGYYRYMKPKKNSGKIKFPVEIKSELELDLPDFDVSTNFTSPKLKERINSECKEVSAEKNNKKKCQSSKLM